MRKNRKIKIPKFNNPFKIFIENANEAVLNNSEIAEENINNSREFFQNVLDKEDKEMEEWR